MCSSPSPTRPWARWWRTTNVNDAWPVRRQTYGYPSSCKASPPTGWYKIILLSDRGTCVLTTCPGLHLTVSRPGFKPVDRKSSILTIRPLSHMYILELSSRVKRGYWHQRADARHGNPPQGNQELLVVRQKLEDARWDWGNQVDGVWYFSLQCFHTVGRATGRASGL